MLRLVVLAMTLVLTAPALAQENRLSVPYQQFQLENGLTVILHQDSSTPVVGSSIWYHVGSANERPGRTGFAHLFRSEEHTSELQSRGHLVCRLLLEKKKLPPTGSRDQAHYRAPST